MNDCTIKSLFYGSMYAPKGLMKEDDAAAAELAQAEQELIQALNPELREKLERYDEANAKLNHSTIESIYIDGFKTGARLMLEVLDNYQEQSHGEDEHGK